MGLWGAVEGWFRHGGEGCGDGGVHGFDAGFWAVRVGPDGVDDGEEVGAGVDEGLGVFGGYAADCDAGEFHDLGPPGEDAGFGVELGLFGGCGVEGAEGDVVGGVFAGLHGEVPAVVAGDAEGEVFADAGAGLAGVHVCLADVDAVAAVVGDEVGAVIEEEGDVAGLGDGAEGFDCAAPVVVVDVFEAELDGGDVARVERAGERVGEGFVGGCGCYEIQPAGAGCIVGHGQCSPL